MTRFLLLAALLATASLFTSPQATCQAQGICIKSSCVSDGECGRACRCGRTGPKPPRGACVLR